MARSQSDYRKIINQIAPFAHLHIQDGVILAIFALDQSEGRNSDHVTCHVHTT